MILSDGVHRKPLVSQITTSVPCPKLSLDIYNDRKQNLVQDNIVDAAREIKDEAEEYVIEDLSWKRTNWY